MAATDVERERALVRALGLPDGTVVTPVLHPRRGLRFSHLGRPVKFVTERQLRARDVRRAWDREIKATKRTVRQCQGGCGKLFAEAPDGSWSEEVAHGTPVAGLLWWCAGCCGLPVARRCSDCDQLFAKGADGLWSDPVLRCCEEQTLAWWCAGCRAAGSGGVHAGA